VSGEYNGSTFVGHENEPEVHGAADLISTDRARE
jgi:hypothetical protein